MPNPLLSARYVHTMSELPANLTLGRLYFVGDEGCIVVDNGRGIETYLVKRGPQGIPGEPLPEIMQQLSDLASASILQSDLIQELNSKHREKLNAFVTHQLERLSAVDTQINAISQAVTELTTVVADIAESFRSSETAILNLLLDEELHPTFTPIQQYDIITTAEGYSFNIADIKTNSDGSGTIQLTLNQ